MNHHNFILEIALKYNRGELLSEEEQAELEAWRERAAVDEGEMGIFPEPVCTEEKVTSLPGLPSEKVWNRIREQIAEKSEDEEIDHRWYTGWPVKAAVAVAGIAVALTGLYRYSNNSHNGLATKRTVPPPAAWRNVAPGHYSGSVSGPDGINIIDSTESSQSKPFALSLPDGSKAWLSYGSSLRYAAHLGDSSREVYLQGQAFFDIARDSRRPFVVHAGQMDVRVLGTRFNLMHYSGLPSEITLIGGKVRVMHGGHGRTLQPSEQATVREGQEAGIKVRKLDRPTTSMAWMDPVPTIEFDSADLHTVLLRVAQYYRVRLDNPKHLKGEPMTGELVLTNSLADNLDLITLAEKGIVRVKQKDNAIQVSDYKGDATK